MLHAKNNNMEIARAPFFKQKHFLTISVLLLQWEVMQYSLRNVINESLTADGNGERASAAECMGGGGWTWQ